jgi:hypothetical protein
LILELVLVLTCSVEWIQILGGSISGMLFDTCGRPAPSEAIVTLEYLPFNCLEILRQTSMGDLVPSNDHLLELPVPVEVFVEIETGQRNWPNRISEQLPKVARALGRVGCGIWRAITEVELDAENKPVEIM